MQEMNIKAFGPINTDLVNAISAAMDNLTPDFGMFHILLSSPGGETSAGVTGYNLIKNSPVPVHVHNMGEVSSAAMLLYLAGKIRTAAPISKFTFHPMALNINGTLPPQAVEENINLISSDITLYSSIIRKEAPKFCEKYDIEHILKHETVTLIDHKVCLDLGIITAES